MNTGDPLLIALLVLVAAVSGALGWLLARGRSEKRIAELSTTLDLERRQAAERLQGLERTFNSLSHEALQRNNQAFLQLAEETLKRYQVQATAQLEQKEKAVEHLVTPIREALQKTEQQIQLMESARKEAYGALTRHLETMALTQDQLRAETQNLVKSLRRPEVRGRWGELTLKRLTELAGMVEHCDFTQQESVSGDEGVLRPDMVVRMPDGREIVVDVKTPLDAYLNAMEATDDTERARQLEHHARKVRERVTELSRKAYWAQFRNTPDFVVLFIPGEQFLSAALDVDHNLLEDALRQKVILATPTSFVALLRAVAYGWRQEAMAANAAQIRDAGEELYARLATFSEHLARLGTSLDSSVAHYNRAIGSFDSKLMPGARKFTEMGVSARKDIEPLAQIEKGVRQISRPDGDDRT
ncbi:MAG: DNA recombination protein RmuC [Gammaproteobacteria bacterium]|nr:DNA recombination protein RmuC [Gammaproteobacteria bacterium]